LNLGHDFTSSEVDKKLCGMKSVLKNPR